MTKKKAFGTPVATRDLRYTDEERIQVVRLLLENSFDYAKTERETGVKGTTIKSWYYRYGEWINKDPSTWIAEKVEINLGRLKTDFLRENYKQIGQLADKAIKRALVLVEKEKDLGKVNGTLKILTDFYTKMQDTNKDMQGSDSRATVNLIRQSIIQLNNLNLNTKKEEKPE